MPDANTKLGEMWTLTQGNLRGHTVKRTLSSLEAKELYTFEWPAESPNLDVIENYGDCSLVIYMPIAGNSIT